MDSSIRLSFLQGTFAVPAAELTPGEWGAFLEQLFRSIKNCLPRIPGFRPLQKTLHAELTAWSATLRPGQSPTFGEGITWTTRCCELRDSPRTGGDDLYLIVRRVLLTDKGQLLLWRTRYYDTGQKSRGVQDIEFVVLQGEVLAAFIKDYPFFAPKVPREWLAVAEGFVKTDRERLRARLKVNRSARGTLQRAIARITW